MNSRRAPLIVGVVAAALAVVLILFLVLPKMHGVDAAKSTLAASQAQQQTLESQLAALQQAQADADKNKAIIAKVQQEIPPTVDEPGMFLLLSNAATRAGIKLWQFTPSPPAPDPSTGLSAIPVAFTVKGSYFALAEFLFNLETLPRVAKVQNATLGDAGASPDVVSSVPFLQMTGSVTLYTSDTSAGPGSAPGPTTTGSTSGA